jgi:hypothetical protein
MLILKYWIKRKRGQMKLYICGNGFDLHHGYKTGYRDYRSFLLKHHEDAFRAFNNFQYTYLSTSDRWSDLEESLTINYEECIDEAVNEYYPDLSDDSDSRWNGIDIDLDEQTKFIFDFTGKYFLEWLTQIDFSKPTNIISINKNALFVTFNYTTTLEKLYGITPGNIFHIHGHVDFADGSIDSGRAKKQIQFGSVDNDIVLIEKEMIKKYGDDDFYAVSIEPGVNHIINFCEAVSKNLERNYAQLKSFIERPKIDEVIVMGHSIMGVDFPYYSKVIVPALYGCRWKFYWHSNKDQDNIESFINQFPLKNYTIVEW